DAEAGRGHLLDLVVAADRSDLVEVGVFTALTRVGTGPDLVHGYREGGVCLRRQSAQGHRGCDKPLTDLDSWLHLVQRDGRGRRPCLQQVAQVLWWAPRRERDPALILLRVARLGSPLGGSHGKRVVGVKLAGFPEANPTVVGQPVLACLRSLFRLPGLTVPLAKPRLQVCT